MQYLIVVVEEELTAGEGQLLFGFHLYFLSEFYSIFTISAAEVIVVYTAFEPVCIVELQLLCCVEGSASTWEGIPS